MWEPVKLALVGSVKEVCALVRVGGKNPKSVWWNNEKTAAVERKEVLGARMRLQKKESRLGWSPHIWL